MPQLKPISAFQATLLFTIPGIAFYFNIKLLVPYLASLTNINAYIAWVITGTLLLFLPLFFLTFVLLKADGYDLNWNTIKTRLRLESVKREDGIWIIAGLLVSTSITTLIIVIWSILPLSFNIEDLKNISPIKVTALHGTELFVFIPLVVFYFFNYFGEELLWRGYILPRQELALGKYAWMVNAVLHTGFHFVFGVKALVPFLPFLFLMAFIAYKRKNTFDAIIIHGLLGAPTQILILLGIMA
jgi:membrane protease YdiL (CAAX protease family)